MHLQWFDWAIVIILAIPVIALAVKSHKYTKSVVDYLAASRCAGRYVCAVAGGEAGLGLISILAMCESFYKSGAGYGFWGSLVVPVAMFLALSGYCTYRYRETRAMTMGQFFEMRYSRKFRMFAAFLQATAGIVNYGIFPAVSARFFIYFLDLPLQIKIWGLNFPTFGVMMAIALAIAMLIIMLGGQITIMITDCIQGLLSYPIYAMIVFFLIWKFSWNDDVLPAFLARPKGESFVNPFNIEKLRDFNLFYALVGIFNTVINRMSWQASVGYSSAARNPHEQKMAGIIGSWRGGFAFLMYILMAIGAYTYMNTQHFNNDSIRVQRRLAVKAASDIALSNGKSEADIQQMVENIQKAEVKVGNDLEAVGEDNLDTVIKYKKQNFATIFNQMRVTAAIRDMLPPVLVGFFVAMMIFLLISTDTTYIHSWSAILVQDIVMPMIGKPLTPKLHLLCLRLGALFVAIFAFCFSFFFSQVDYILMFFAITGAIWLGGAGPCIVFGLYWKRGTTAGAFASLISGSLLAVGGILMQNTWESTLYPFLNDIGWIPAIEKVLQAISGPLKPLIDWHATNPKKFPINSQEIYFIAMIVSIFLYITISLIFGPKEGFNMDKMLHRGKYRVLSDQAPEAKPEKKSFWQMFFDKFVGITPQHTFGDKCIAWGLFTYSFVINFGCFFVLVLLWHLFGAKLLGLFGCAVPGWLDTSKEIWWANFFLVKFPIKAGLIGIFTTIWLSWGGIRDMRQLFKDLDAKKEDFSDDGSVK